MSWTTGWTIDGNEGQTFLLLNHLVIPSLPLALTLARPPTERLTLECPLVSRRLGPLARQLEFRLERRDAPVRMSVLGFEREEPRLEGRQLRQGISCRTFKGSAGESLEDFEPYCECLETNVEQARGLPGPSAAEKAEAASLQPLR